MRISCTGFGESVEIMAGELGCLLGLLLGMFSLVLLKVVVLAKCKPTVSILTMHWWFVLGGLKYFMVFLFFTHGSLEDIWIKEHVKKWQNIRICPFIGLL